MTPRSRSGIKCVICPNSYRHSARNVRFFRFPKITLKRREWEKACRMAPLKIQNYNKTRICSEHFEKKWFGLRFLLQDAVPTLKLPNSKIAFSNQAASETSAGNADSVYIRKKVYTFLGDNTIETILVSDEENSVMDDQVDSHNTAEEACEDNLNSSNLQQDESDQDDTAVETSVSNDELIFDPLNIPEKTPPRSNKERNPRISELTSFDDFNCYNCYKMKRKLRSYGKQLQQHAAVAKKQREIKKEKAKQAAYFKIKLAREKSKKIRFYNSYKQLKKRTVADMIDAVANISPESKMFCKMLLKNKNSWNDKEKMLAKSIYLCSSKGYDFIRNKLSFNLPSKTSLCRFVPFSALPPDAEIAEMTNDKVNDVSAEECENEI